MNKITDKNLFGNIPKSSGEQFAEGEVLSPGVTPKRQHLRAETWQEAMMAPGTVERDGPSGGGGQNGKGHIFFKK